MMALFALSPPVLCHGIVQLISRWVFHRGDPRSNPCQGVVSVIDWKLWLLDLDGKGLGGCFHIKVYRMCVCIYAIAVEVGLKSGLGSRRDTFIGVS